MGTWSSGSPFTQPPAGGVSHDATGVSFNIIINDVGLPSADVTAAFEALIDLLDGSADFTAGGSRNIITPETYTP